MDFDKAYDLLDNVRSRLEVEISNSSVELMPSDTDDFFITVTQRNETTGNESKWSFCVDFGTNTVQMLEPTEDEESFGNANEVFGIIKNFLNGGSSREKRRNRPDYDSGEPIKITGFGNKIGSSNKTVVRQGPNLKTLDETPAEHIIKNLDAYKGYTRYDMEQLVLNPSGYTLYDGNNRKAIYKKDGAEDIILFFKFNKLKDAKIASSRKPIKSSFTQDELNCLREMIVDGMDERFYDWYSEKYGDEPWKASNEQMVEWIKSDPEITKEYNDYLKREMPYYEPGHDDKYVNEFLKSSTDIERSFEKNFPYLETKYIYDPNMINEDTKTVTFEDYGDVNDMDERLGRFREDVENSGYKLNIRNSKTIKSSITIDDKFEEYVGSDLFAERYGYDDYRVDKLSDMGFTPEQIEFEWDSPKIQRALKKIDKEFDKNSNDYYRWAADVLENDTLLKTEYERWRDNYNNQNL